MARVIAVSGLAFEARIAAGRGVVVICAGERETLLRSLQQAVEGGCRGILSFGTAGALDPDLETGRWVVATGIVAGTDRFATFSPWTQRLTQSLAGAVAADVAGVDAPVADPAAKRALRESSGAVAADMESHIAAEVAAARQLPFAACRVIVDAADRMLPPAALAAVRRDGTVDFARVLAEVMRAPGQLPALVRLARDAQVARSALARGRRLLGAGLGFPDLGLL